MQTGDDLIAALSERDTIFGELESHHKKRNILRSVCLGGSHTDFGTGIDMDTAMRLTRDGRTDSVDNTDTQGTTLEAVSHSQDGICSFSTL